MMRGIVLAVLACLFVSGCGEDVIEKGRAAAALRLKDPSSAQFRGDYVTSIGSVCGEINGKNGFGGYSGFERYMSSRGKDGEFTAMVASEDPVGILDTLCSKPTKK